MKKGTIVGVLAVIAMMAGGCVSTGKYNAAVSEAQGARTDLEKIRAQKNALEQQVKSLKELNGKLSADAEFVSAELQRVKEGRDKERAAVEGRVKDLEDKTKDLTAQHRNLRQEYEVAKKQNEGLKSTVARYQKELKERERAAVAPPPPPVSKPPAAAPGTPPPAMGSSAPGPSAKPSPQPGLASPIPAPVAPAPKGPSVPSPGTATASAPPASTPVNINTASANDMVLFLGLSKEVAERVIANRPYRIKGEMVAKNVVPKTTFDAIKDRITVGQ